MPFHYPIHYFFLTNQQPHGILNTVNCIQDSVPNSESRSLPWPVRYLLVSSARCLPSGRCGLSQTWQLQMTTKRASSKIVEIQILGLKFDQYPMRVRIFTAADRTSYDCFPCFNNLCPCLLREYYFVRVTLSGYFKLCLPDKNCRIT